MIDVQDHLRRLQARINELAANAGYLGTELYVVRQSRSRLVQAMRRLCFENHIWDKHSFVEIIGQRDAANMRAEASEAALKTAVADEREACAKVARDMQGKCCRICSSSGWVACPVADCGYGNDISGAIRARGKQ